MTLRAAGSAAREGRAGRLLPAAALGVTALIAVLGPAPPLGLPPPTEARAVAGPAGDGARLLPRPAGAQPTPPAQAEPDDCEPRALLESPVGEGPFRGVVPVGGWAVDLSSPAGTGVSEVHVYVDGYGAEPGHAFVGRAEYGASRVDVAQLLNDARFARSAFSLSWDASTAGAGAHALVILVRTRCGWASLTQPIEVDGPTIQLQVDAPPQGSQIAGPVRLQGWAADPRAPAGTGVERIDLYLDGQVTTRGVPLGDVPYGESRPDVAAALGGDSEAARARFSRSGFSVFWHPVGVTPGPHTLTFYARGPDGAVARSLALDVTASAVRPTLTTPGVGGSSLPAGTSPGGVPVGRGAEVVGAVVTATAPTSASLAWVPASGAVTYDVYASEGVAAFFPAQTGLAETRATVSGLAPGRSYRLYVRALDGGGTELGRSTTINVTTPTSPLSVTPAASPTPRLTPGLTPGAS